MMDVSQAATALGALAQEKRLELLRLLLNAGPDGIAPGELAARLEMPNSTLSFHLSALERADLTQSSRQGRQVTHAVRVAGLQELLRFLTETCCESHPQLCFETPVRPPLAEPAGMTAAFNVLFLCTHNAARSIMAESILGKVGGGRFRAYSAGSDPAEKPFPEVIEKLRTIGHDVTGLYSKSWNLFTGPAAPRIDFVIALCDTLDGQNCPDFGQVAITGAWPLPDPAKFGGGAIERSTMLNELYASLHRRVSIFAALPFATLDRMAMKTRLDALGGGGLPVIVGLH